MTIEVVTAVIVASHHPTLWAVSLGAATRSRRRHLVIARVLHHGERAYGAGTVLEITNAEGMIHGTDTGIAGVDEDVYSLEVSP